MFRRFRRFLRRNFYQIKGAINASIAIIFHGLEHFDSRLKQIDDDLQKRAEEISDSNERIIWTLVGQALSAWATMEEALVMTTAILLRSDGARAGLVLYSIINFNVWLTIISELFAMDSALASYKSRWNKISERIRKIKDVRDRIAHESTDQVSGELGVLRPSDLDVRPKSKLFKPLAQDEIVNFSRVVAEIAKDVVTLSKEMMAILDSSAEKSSELGPDRLPESYSR